MTRIAIVDDEPDVLSLLTLVIRDGFQDADVRGYPSPAAILADVDAPADVVLTDYRMPGMDGLKLIAELHAAWPAARFILMTAFADSSIEERAVHEEHIVRYLNKVADPDAFVDAVRAAFPGPP